MKHFILFLSLASLAFGQSATLSVNPSTGAIRGPITAETFKTVNNLGGVSAFSDLTGKPTTLEGYGITDAQPYAANLLTWAGVAPSANGQSLVSAANYAAMRALLDLEAGTDFLAFPTGTPTGSKYLRDDNTWQPITGGDVTLTGTNVYTAGSSTFNSGTTVAVNGTFGGTPTGGTLDLSNVAVTFGTVGATTLNATSATVGGLSLAAYNATLMDTSAELAAILTDETGTGALVFAGGNIGAATATTPAADDDSTKVATTAYVQTEISGLGSGDSVPTNGLILWPTSLLGSLPTGFLEADGTEGTLDMGAIESGTWIQKTAGVAPTLSSATIGTNGTTFTMVFSEPVDIGAGGNGGFVPTMSTGSPSLTYASGDGSDTLVYTLSSTVIDTTTGTLAYTQPGNGIEDAIGLDLLSFSGTSITNNSTQSAFTYYSAVFDGTNDYLSRGTEMTGNVDGDKGTVSFWIKMDPSSSNTSAYFIYGSSGNRVQIQRDASGRVAFAANNPSNTTVLNIRTGNNAVINSSGWHHVIASWDLSTAGRRYIYVDGVDATNQVTFTTSSTIDYTTGANSVGAATGGSFKFYGLLSEVYVNFADYLDLSNSTNREKFRTISGYPADLGADGSTPTGTAPLVYLRTAVPDWETNSGTGGTFTENGTLVDGASDKP